MFGVFGSAKPEWKYDEISTPKTEEDYKSVGQEILRKRSELIHDDNGWTTVSCPENEDDITAVKIEQKVINSSIATVRVTGYVKLEGKTIKELAKELFDPTEESRKKLYTSVVSYDKLKDINPYINVGRTVGESTGITNRELLAMRILNKIKNGYLIGVESINDENIPFDPSCVRGVNRSGVQLSSVTDSIVQIISVDFIDPKGWVPGMVINSFISSAGDWIKRL